ncbi:MAG: hypothetical protein Q7K65_00935 [Candidatus Buchananbacteria bacterium]|nr:hypothetical protein [Candidatus Buchananbacteria bacterium]
MCRDWKQEECNHHFPELRKKRNILKMLLSLVTPKKLSLVIVSLTFVITGAYLMQINLTATKGYEIKDLESRLNQLQEENKKLNLSYVELQSMANILEQVPKLNLVATENIEILTPAGSVVALR